MDASIQKHHRGSAEELLSLNIDDLDVEELERRLEMALAMPDDCVARTCSGCPNLATCGTFCT